MRNAIVFLLLLSGPAEACFGSRDLRQTFFETLPDALSEAPVVARVKLLKIPPPNRYLKISFEPAPEALVFPAEVTFTSAVYEVEVVKAVKGIEFGKKFEVTHARHSCASNPKVSVGAIFYVAGRFDDGKFRGTWRRGDLF